MTEVTDETGHRAGGRPSRGPTPAPREIHLGSYLVRLPSPNDPRLHLAVVTTALQVLGQTVFGFNVSIAEILVTITVCGLIDFSVTLVRDHAIAWPASGLLTGNGIALILRVPGTQNGDWWSFRSWWIFAGAGILALASKYLIRVHGRHIFNPSNIALVVTFVLLGSGRVDPQVLWWGPFSAGLVLAFAVILAGSVVITRKVGQSASALSFWVVFATAVGLIAATGHSITASWHVGAISGWDYWVLLVTSPEVLVFLFFMITDPKTAPSQRRGQVIYGAAIALVGAAIIATQGDEFGTKVGILAGLTLISPFVGLIRAHASSWTATRRFGLRVGGAISVSLAAVALLASTTGSAARVAVTASPEHRADFPVDMSSLPEVAIDPPEERLSTDLDQVLANQLAHDVIQDLEMEASALGPKMWSLHVRFSHQDDSRRWRAPSTRAPPKAMSSSTTSSLFEPSSYRPPRARRRRRHSACMRAAQVSVDNEAADLDAIYLTRETDGVHLITGAVSPDGKRLPPPAVERDSADSADEPELPAAPSNSPAAIPPPWNPGDPALGSLTFTEVTAQAGLDEPYAAVPLRDDEGMSSGVAAADIDNDGDIDLFVPRFGKPDALFVNDGAGHFSDIAASAGVQGPDDGQGSATGSFADLNGDGHLDLIVIGTGTRSNRLYMNRGDNTFSDETSERGIPTTDLVDSGESNQMHDVAIADVNGDGALDLLLLHWWDTLTQGDSAVDSVEAEIAVRGNGILDSSGCARSTVLREAGFPVDDDSGPNRSALMLNDGKGHFSDVTNEYNLPLDEVVAFTGEFNDLDGDGLPDLAITGDYCTLAPVQERRWQTFRGCDCGRRCGHRRERHGFGDQGRERRRTGRLAREFDQQPER